MQPARDRSAGVAPPLVWGSPLSEVPRQACSSETSPPGLGGDGDGWVDESFYFKIIIFL